MTSELGGDVPDGRGTLVIRNRPSFVRVIRPTACAVGVARVVEQLDGLAQ